MPPIARRQDLLRKRLTVFTRMLPAVADGDISALHRARVASRRLRELIPVLELDDATAAKLSRRLRRATARLGRVRELDVQVMALDELGKSGDHEPRALDRVRAAIAQRQSDARTALVDGETLSKLRRLGAKLEALLDRIASDGAERRAGAPRRGWTWAVDARIARRADRLRGAVEEAGTVYSPERLHDARIALKKFRYALELQADARGVKSSGDLRALKRGQDLLGRLHDLQVLIAAARGVESSAGSAGPAIDRFIDALEVDCRRLHARFLRERATILAVCDRAIASSSRRARKPAADLRRSA